MGGDAFPAPKTMRNICPSYDPGTFAFLLFRITQNDLQGVRKVYPIHLDLPDIRAKGGLAGRRRATRKTGMRQELLW